MAMSWPVMAAASADSRNATRAAISPGCISRPIGGMRAGLAARAGSSSMPVCVAAGDTTFTVTPWPVSYTHLDVYKRQSPSSVFTPTVVIVLQLGLMRYDQLANSAADLKPDPGE